jgi:hypothetical protein
MIRTLYMNVNKTKVADMAKELLSNQEIYDPRTIDLIEMGRASFQVIPTRSFTEDPDEQPIKIINKILGILNSKGYDPVRYVIEKKGSEHECIAIKRDKLVQEGTFSYRIAIPDGLPVMVRRKFKTRNPDIFAEPDVSATSFWQDLYKVRAEHDDCLRQKTYYETRLPYHPDVSLTWEMRSRYRDQLKKNFGSREKFLQRLIAARERKDKRSRLSPIEMNNILKMFWSK